MQTILPAEDFGQKMFECPNKECGWRHWFTNKQLEKNRLVVTCNCGTTFRPRLVLEEASSKKKQTTSRVLSDRNAQIALTVLEARMDKKKAQEAVIAVFSEILDLEELIQEAINYAK